MDNLILALNAPAGMEASKKETGLENKCKAAMKAVIKTDWNCSSDDTLFRCALAGVFQDVGQDSEDGQLLLRSAEHLKRLSAFLNACQAGLSVDVPEVEEEIVPLMGWWHEVKAVV